jgi:hypothetical protein
MKKSILIIEILFMALLVGCQDDDSPNLIIEKESIQAEYNGGTTTYLFLVILHLKQILFMNLQKKMDGFFYCQLY